MCTAAEPASQGHDSGARAGSHGARASAMRPAPTDNGRGREGVEVRGIRGAFSLGLASPHAGAQPLQPPWTFAQRDFRVRAEMEVRAELSPRMAEAAASEVAAKQAEAGRRVDSLD